MRLFRSIHWRKAEGTFYWFIDLLENLLYGFHWRPFSLAEKKCFYCVLYRFLFNSVSSNSHFIECFPVSVSGAPWSWGATMKMCSEEEKWDGGFSAIFADIFVIKIRVWRRGHSSPSKVSISQDEFEKVCLRSKNMKYWEPHHLNSTNLTRLNKEQRDKMFS